MGNIKYASKIDLSNQGLTEIPSYVYECRNLKKLNLSNNEIKEIPIELSMLKYLKNLDISNNKITQLYSKTFDLRNLTSLNLNNNKIRTLPKQIGNLPKLNTLLIAGNLLDKLPDEIENLTNLKALNISKNKFVNFPNSILKLSGITHLWIGTNSFQTIPLKEINRNLVNLKSIYCYEAISTLMPINKGIELLTTQRSNVINTIKLMEYQENGAKSNSFGHVNPPQKIFISYSHKDEKYKDEVETTLNGMKNVFPDIEFNYWVDTKIKSGTEWFEEIKNALETSGIAILIISRNFFASNFIMKTEVPKLLDNLRKNGMPILCLIAGHSLFKKSVLEKFQTVNDPNRPLKSLTEHEQDVIYTKLAEDVKRYLIGE